MIRTKEDKKEAVVKAIVKSVFLSIPGAIGMGILIMFMQIFASFGAIVFISFFSSWDDPINLDPWGLTDFDFTRMCYAGYFIALGTQLWWFLTQEELKFDNKDYQDWHLHEISIGLVIVCLIISVIVYPRVLLSLILGIPMLLLYLASRK